MNTKTTRRFAAGILIDRVAGTVTPWTSDHYTDSRDATAMISRAERFAEREYSKGGGEAVARAVAATVEERDARSRAAAEEVARIEKLAVAEFARHFVAKGDHRDAVTRDEIEAHAAEVSAEEYAAELLAEALAENARITKLLRQQEKTVEKLRGRIAELEARPTAPREKTAAEAPARTFEEIEAAAEDLGIEVARNSCNTWVSGNTRPIKDELKALGFHWAPKRGAWYRKAA